MINNELFTPKLTNVKSRNNTNSLHSMNLNLRTSLVNNGKRASDITFNNSESLCKRMSVSPKKTYGNIVSVYN